VSGSDSKSVSVGGVSLTPRAILAIVIGIAALIFVFSNTEQVTLQFLWFSLEAAGWVMLLILLLAGFATGFFVGRNRYKRK
jgi:uncharacterized integral membrane protein